MSFAFPTTGLTDEEQATQRVAFLHFMQACAGTEVEADVADGKTAVKGYFHTGTPFKERPFRVSIKSGKRGDDETASEIGATQVGMPVPCRLRYSDLPGEAGGCALTHQ